MTTWARVLDDAVAETAPAPPTSLPNEDGSVTLGITEAAITELAAAGWLPVSDAGPSWDDRLQSWDGAAPTLAVTPGGVSALYTVAERSIETVRAEALAAVDAAEAAALSDLRRLALDTLLAGDVPVTYAADRAAAHATAEAARDEIRARARPGFAGTVVSRPPMT